MQRPPSPEPERRQEIFRGCQRFLSGHGPRHVATELAALAAAAGDAGPDVYGKGGVLEELEHDVARLLGKPAALFLPSGTMAQQIALRLHAETARCRRVAFHPTCHLELHEQRAYSELHGLEARLVGQRDRLLELADLEAVGEPLAALLLELPQRELGGVLPSWAELLAQADWARRSGIALHMDGARLWECAPFYARSHADLAAPFDSVYVSFYKALGAIAGALLAGSEALVAGARVWQRRHGGNLVSMYPFALSARAGLEARLGKLAEYNARARRIAERWRSIEGVRVTPDPPHTNMFHAYFPVAGERLLAASVELAAAERVALFTRTRSCDVPGYCAVEVSIGDAAAALDDAELLALVRRVLEHAQQDCAASG
jgi:threonine aldolase